MPQAWGVKNFPNSQRPHIYDIEKDTNGNDRFVWKTPSKCWNEQTKDIIFANVDVKYRMVPIEEVPLHCTTKKMRVYKNVLREIPVLDIYGITEDEHSVTTHVWDVEPYFYVSCHIPKGENDEVVCRRVKHRLQCLMMGIDPDMDHSKHQNMNREYWEKYSKLIPGEINLDDFNEDEEIFIPEGELAEKFQVFVHDIEVVHAKSLFGAHMRDRKFFKVTMVSPRMITKARDFFEVDNRFRNNSYGSAVRTFESNVQFITRIMCDKRIKGMHWVRARWDKDTRISINKDNGYVNMYPYLLNPKIADVAESIFKDQNENGKDMSPTTKKILNDNLGLLPSISTSQIEFDVLKDNIEGIPDHEDYKNKLPPILIFSFDIECANSVTGMFPSETNEGDKVILICGTKYRLGQASKPIEFVSFLLGSMDGELEIEDKWNIEQENLFVYKYKSEEELFEGFQGYLRESDPDLITGYNIFGFDIKYLFKRAKYLKLSPNQWGMIGRNTDSPTRLRKCTFQSNAYGRKDFEIAMISGRCQLDELESVYRDFSCGRMRGYNLGDVSQEKLNETKEDLPFYKITEYYLAGGAKRKLVIKYCFTDAYLPARLEEKLGHVVLYVEQARLYGINLTELILRGQQHRLYSFLIGFLLDFNANGNPKYLIPKNDRMEREETKGRAKARFSGATVIEPKRGFYEEPVATLDFMSLYPSIMMAHNLCYTTLIPPYMVKRFHHSQYFVSPSGDAFFYNNIKEGILPLILRVLLSARSVAKKQMANAKNPSEKAMYNAKQNAIKVGANSVYGFTGATIGKLPCLSISSAVTSYGRQYIQTTRDFVHKIPMLSSMKDYPLPPDTPFRIDKQGN